MRWVGAEGLPPPFAESLLAPKMKAKSQPVLSRIASLPPRPIKVFIPKTKIENEEGLHGFWAVLILDEPTG